MSSSVLELLSLAAAYGIESGRLTADGRLALNAALDALTVPRNGERGFSRASLIVRFEEYSRNTQPFDWLPSYVERVKLELATHRKRTRMTTRDSFDWAVVAPSAGAAEDWDRGATTA